MVESESQETLLLLHLCLVFLLSLLGTSGSLGSLLLILLLEGERIDLVRLLSNKLTGSFLIISEVPLRLDIGSERLDECWYSVRYLPPLLI